MNNLPQSISKFRRSKFIFASIFLVFALTVSALSQNLNLDNSFNAGVSDAQSNVYTSTVQPDGKILVGGLFYFINGVQRQFLVRLNTDGSLDTSFNVGNALNGGVYEIFVLADGKLLIGGSFTTYNGTAKGGLARLNADGSLDTTFNPNAFDRTAAEYFAIQPDGKILVAGAFLDFSDQRFSLIRLNIDGSFDSSFQLATSNETGYSVKTQPDGKIMLTGFFTRFSNEDRRGIARLNSNGSLDASFNATFTNFGTVETIARQTDGKIVVGGVFQRANGAANINVARFNQNGTLDTTFNTGTGTSPDLINPFNQIYDIAVQPDGKILVGGSFGFFNDVPRASIVRLNTDGSIDLSFTPSFFDPTQLSVIYDIFVQSDGKILLGGTFVSADQSSIIGLVRLNSNGSLDSTFNSTGVGSVNSAVRQIARQDDGKFIIGGTFTTYNGQSRNRIARLNTNGTLDTSFNPGTGANGTVLEIAPQADGKILVGGSFTTVNAVSRVRLARLNVDGSLDTTFTVGTGANSSVNAVELLPDGKIIIGGLFGFYNGVTANRLARINADGSLDTTFVSGFSNNPIQSVRDILVQPDGNILVGGLFDSYNGSARNSLLRLTTNVPRSAHFDFDGDGKADLSVFRPENGAWYLQQSSAGFAGIAFGVSTDKLVPADYDGDGKTDVAVVRNGVWYLQRSQSGFTGIQFGDANDIPVPADYDGDGKAELAVFRPSNGYWYVLNLTNNQLTATLFGISTDRPVPADYDGDGKTDIAVNRNGNWYIQRSQLGFTGIQFGDGTDKLAPADYDGDRKADIAVFRPSNGAWYLLQSTGGFASITFGLGTDSPAAADYDGDGKADLAVVRNGNWYLNRTTQGFIGIVFGTSTDKPLPNTYIR